MKDCMFTFVGWCFIGALVVDLVCLCLFDFVILALWGVVFDVRFNDFVVSCFDCPFGKGPKLGFQCLKKIKMGSS